MVAWLTKHGHVAAVIGNGGRKYVGATVGKDFELRGFFNFPNALAVAIKYVGVFGPGESCKLIVDQQNTGTTLPIEASVLEQDFKR